MDIKVAFVMHDFSVLGGVEKVTSNLIGAFLRHGIEVWGIVSYHQLNSIPIITYPSGISIVVESDIDKIFYILKGNGITHTILQVGDVKKQSLVTKKMKNENIKVYSIIHNTPYFWLKKFFIHNFLDLLRFVKMEIFTTHRNKLYLKNLISDSDNIFFVSKAACDEAKSLFPELRDKIDYMYNISFQDMVDNSTICPKENIIIYAGRFSREKRAFSSLQILVPLLKKYPEWEFWILGDGEERAKIENYLEEKKSQNIRYIGSVSNVDDYLQKSKICILYSYFEGLPTILLEAVQYKNLIVANQGKGGFADIVQDGKNGFLVLSDKEFYDKVELLMSNQEVYDTMSNNFISYQQFSESEIMKRWQQILLG